MVRKIVTALVLSVCVACGGGSAPAPVDAAPLTAQDLVESCVTTDLQDLAALLDVLQNLLDPASELPAPDLDLLQFLVDGTIGWSLDIDEDGTVDLSGSVGFLDAGGMPTLPIDIGDIIGGAPLDLATVLANIEAGTTLDLDFEMAGALATDGAGSGTLSFLFDDAGVASVSGDGIFESAACMFEFDFADIDAFDPAVDGFPVASLGFGLTADDQRLGGSIDLDGSNVAEVRAALDGGTEEVFRIDLETGALLGS
jgi:hypothetical protein